MIKKLEPKNCLFCLKEFSPRESKSKLCSKKCKCEWIKQNSRETKVCLHCNKEFKVYKSSKLPGLFCSNDCSRVSDYKRNKLIEWNKNFTNPFKNPEKQKLARETKIAKYGTLFANQEKRSKTNIERYGSLMPAKNSSNGIRISKV